MRAFVFRQLLQLYQKTGGKDGSPGMGASDVRKRLGLRRYVSELGEFGSRQERLERVLGLPMSCSVFIRVSFWTVHKPT